jgi:hypothetical protein|tara:strand:+ start:277 stop:555 length:279 start_codon:yes stop_codon:yes gene_type:complete
MKPTMNVWIELQKPDENYTGKEIADNANRMLKRLGVNDGKFQYNDPKYKSSNYMGCLYIYNSDVGISGLEDNGRWFNLAYFGRELVANKISA